MPTIAAVTTGMIAVISSMKHAIMRIVFRNKLIMITMRPEINQASTSDTHNVKSARRGMEHSVAT